MLERKNIIIYLFAKSLDNEIDFSSLSDKMRIQHLMCILRGLGVDLTFEFEWDKKFGVFSESLEEVLKDIETNTQKYNTMVIPKEEDYLLMVAMGCNLIKIVNKIVAINPTDLSKEGWLELLSSTYLLKKTYPPASPHDIASVLIQYNRAFTEDKVEKGTKVLQELKLVET